MKQNTEIVTTRIIDSAADIVTGELPYFLSR